LASLLWTQRQDIGPSARYGHALAWDKVAEDVLLIGGNGPGDLHHDTWRWNGVTWTQVEDIGPPARAEHAIASDSARSRVILFGGRSGSGPLADTWEWDGTAWTQVADTGPSARSRHALAYDSARSRVVLFGGEDTSGLLGDTWEWDGDGWTQIADTGPAARSGHAMCFEIPAARTVLFGGSNGSDTWTWNGTQWTGINDVGPEPRQGTALVFAGTITVLFGGIDPTSGVLFGGTWQLEGTDWTERQDIGPAERQGHAMTYDETRQQVVLFGGSAAPSATATADDLFSDTWELPPPAGLVMPTAPILVGFQVNPNVVPQLLPFTLEVLLNQPAQTPTSVMVTESSGLLNEIVVVPAGSTSASLSLNPPSATLPPGIYSLTATLGGITLTASLQVL
jgi:Galactose oxidase, central domain